MIHFWFSWGLESNAFNMYMDRQEINALYTYLRFVTGKIALDDTDIVSLIQKECYCLNSFKQKEESLHRFKHAGDVLIQLFISATMRPKALYVSVNRL